MKKFIAKIIEKIKSLFGFGKKVKKNDAKDVKRVDKEDPFKEEKENIEFLLSLLEPENTEEYDEELTHVEPATPWPNSSIEQWASEVVEQYPNVKEKGITGKEKEMAYIEALLENRDINKTEYAIFHEEIERRYMTKKEALRKYPLPKESEKNKE